MERFAAEVLEGQRDAQIKAAIKANVPWTQLAEDFGLPLGEIIKITERLGLTSPRRDKDELLDARKEGRHG
jgi:hypothetical protein